MAEWCRACNLVKVEEGSSCNVCGVETEPVMFLGFNEELKRVEPVDEYALLRER